MSSWTAESEILSFLPLDSGVHPCLPLHSHIALSDPPRGATTLPLIFQILRRKGCRSSLFTDSTSVNVSAPLGNNTHPPRPINIFRILSQSPLGHTQSKDPAHLDRVHQRVPSGHQSRWRSTSLFQLILSTNVLLTVYLVPYFPHLCAFCW